MPKARLNKKQRHWRDRFLEKYPYYHLREVWSDLAGDRILVLEGTEYLPAPLVVNYEGEYVAWIHHKLKVKLRVFGDVRYTAEHQWQIGREQIHSDSRQGQMSLPIQQALAIPKPTNPVIVKCKRKQESTRKKNIQLNLPVTGLEAELFQHRLQKRPHLPPVSSQEILAEKVSTWSMRDQREVQLPQAVVDILMSMAANDNEWQDAIDLFGVAGPSCALEFALNLPTFRRWKGLPEMPLVGQSQVVETSHKRDEKEESLRVQARLS